MWNYMSCAEVSHPIEMMSFVLLSICVISCHFKPYLGLSFYLSLGGARPGLPQFPSHAICYMIYIQSCLPDTMYLFLSFFSIVLCQVL